MTLKGGRRHSRDDNKRIRSARAKAREIDGLMAELGDDDYEDSDTKNMGETLIAYGSAIKALDNGHIGGYLVTFGSEKQTDLSGDFFTKDTDFGFEKSIKTAVYFNHRLPLKTADGGSLTIKAKVGEGTLTKDDNGILIDAILYNRAEYEKGLEALGWSSGTAGHLVEAESVGSAQWLRSWPLGLDASMTPMPAEPRNHVVPLKSLAQDQPQAAGEAAAGSDEPDDIVIII